MCLGKRFILAIYIHACWLYMYTLGLQAIQHSHPMFHCSTSSENILWGTGVYFRHRLSYPPKAPLGENVGSRTVLIHVTITDARFGLYVPMAIRYYHNVFACNVNFPSLERCIIHLLFKQLTHTPMFNLYHCIHAYIL